MKMQSVTTTITVDICFYRLDPVEVNIDGDSIDRNAYRLKVRRPASATLRINGNDRL